MPIIAAEDGWTITNVNVLWIHLSSGKLYAADTNQSDPKSNVWRGKANTKKC